MITPMQSGFVIVLTTLPADEDCEGFARTLVDERLAACVNILSPMESFYRWRGAVEHGTERQLIIKTGRDRVEELQQRIASMHPYDVPEILVLPVSGADNYLSWISESIGSSSIRH